MSVRSALLIIVFTLVSPCSALALPWDTDMFRQQSLKAGEVARAPVKGTVPVGQRPTSMSLEEAEKTLKNPRARNVTSVWRGQRLWNTHCSVCHGISGDGKGPVGPTIGAPALLEDPYKSKSDARIYGVMFYGLRAMPRQGFKLSDTERWDIVNYLRFLQGEEVPGMMRPEKGGN